MSSGPSGPHTRGLVEAMHTFGGCEFRGVAQWLALAATRDDLRAAFNKCFGTQLPHVTKAGKWLRKRDGKTYGELRLVSVYDTHRQSYTFGVETAEETRAREWKAAEEQEARELVEREKYIRANERLLKKALEKEEEGRREAEELRALSGLTLDISVQPEALLQRHDQIVEEELEAGRLENASRANLVLLDASPEPTEAAPAVPTLTITKAPAPEVIMVETKVTSDGRVIKTPILAPPKPEAHAPTKAAPAPEQPAAPVPTLGRVTCGPNNTGRLPPWVRENRRPTRAELAAAHVNGSPFQARKEWVWVRGLGEQLRDVKDPVGFSDPGGVVARNVATESGTDVRTRKLRLLDF